MAKGGEEAANYYISRVWKGLRINGLLSKGVGDADSQRSCNLNSRTGTLGRWRNAGVGTACDGVGVDGTFSEGWDCEGEDECHDVKDEMHSC